MKPLPLFFLVASTATSYAAISFTYDASSSNPSAHQYVYDGTDVLGTSIEMTLNVTLWDDSANAFDSTFSYTPGVSGNNNTGSLGSPLAPGDYLCLEYSLNENMTVYNPFHPQYAGGSNIQLATSLTLDGANSYGEELLFIYTPGVGSDFHDATSNVSDRDFIAGTANAGSHGQGTQTFADTASNDYADIESLLTGTSSWFTYDETGMTLTSDQEAQLVDNRNNAPDSETQGFTWYVGNIGTQDIAAGTQFNQTFGGVAVPVPEPSRTALLVLGCLGALTLRRR